MAGKCTYYNYIYFIIIGRLSVISGWFLYLLRKVHFILTCIMAILFYIFIVYLSCINCGYFDCFSIAFTCHSYIFMTVHLRYTRIYLGGYYQICEALTQLSYLLSWPSQSEQSQNNQTTAAKNPIHYHQQQNHMFDYFIQFVDCRQKISSSMFRFLQMGSS